MLQSTAVAEQRPQRPEDTAVAGNTSDDEQPDGSSIAGDTDSLAPSDEDAEATARRNARLQPLHPVLREAGSWKESSWFNAHWEVGNCSLYCLQ